MVVGRKLKIGIGLVIAGAVIFTVTSSVRKQAEIAAAISGSEAELAQARTSMEEAYQAQLELLAFWLTNKSLSKRIKNPSSLQHLVQRLKENDLGTPQQMKQFDADLVQVANAFGGLAPLLHPEDQMRLFKVDQDVNTKRARYSELAFKHNKLIAAAQSVETYFAPKQIFETKMIFESDRLILEANEASAVR